MKDDMKWLIERFDRLDKRLDEQGNTLTRLTVTVEEHVRRTNLLEAKVLPMARKVTMVEGVVGFLLLVASLTAIYRLFI